MVHEDRISELPNNILISIISRLTLKEATSTCILSSRWRLLHTYVTRLNFPKYRYGIDTESSYVSMIDHVLDSHRGTKIKELVVDLCPVGCNNFEKWFEFGLIKKAEIIYLDGLFHNEGPFLRLRNTNGIECLKELWLGNIKMTDQDFELLVSNCPALEYLKIESSIKLKNISIIGHSILKNVILYNGWQLESIVIRDTINLVSLAIYDARTGCAIQLSNIPKLTKLNFQESFDVLMLAELLVKIPSCIRDQLQLLRLSTTFDSYSDKSREDLVLHELLWVDLVNVKHLELVIETNDYHFFDGPFECYVRRLIEACGSLEKLVIKFMHEQSQVMGRYRRPMCEECREVMHMDRLAECKGCQRLKIGERELGIYQHAELSVKYLEITGYFGSSWQRELALYIINSAKSFQKLTLVTYDQVALARARHDFRHTPNVLYDDTGSSFRGRPELE